jgi:hypothetical protein
VRATEIARLFARVGADISEFTSKMRAVDDTSQRTAQAMGKELGQGADEASRALAQLASGAGGLGQVIAAGLQATTVIGGVTVAVKALQEGIRAGIAAQDLAQQVDQIAGAYERLAAVSLSEGGAQLGEATMGGMSDVDAAQMAMKLISMDLAKSNEDAAKLLGIATQLTRLSGGSIQGLLPLLTNQSSLRLDEFLVSGDAVKRLKEQYEAAGMESGEAFMQAFMVEAQKTLDEVGPIEPTIKEREAATAENMKNAVASSFGGSMSAQALGGIREGWNNAKQSVADYFQRVADGQAITAEYYKEIRGYFESGLITQEEFNAMKGGWDMWAQGAAFGLVSVEKLREGLEKTLDLDGDLSRLRGLKVMRDDLSNAAAQAEHLEMVLARLDGQQVDVQVSLGWQSAQDERMAAWIYGQRMTGLGRSMMTPEPPPRDDGRSTWLDEDTLAAHQTMQGYGDALQAWLYPEASGGGGGLGGGRSAASQRASELRSLAQGLLQPTQVTAADMAATEMGVYQDKWDEAVRRFRMAENGRNAYEIAQYEREFYGGKRLDEVNWEGLIAAGRSEVEYKAGQENLLQTAMQKLAAAGVGMDKGAVAELLGLPADYETTGAERAADFVRGFDGAAAEITTTVATEMRDQVDTWLQLGLDVADWFGDGFEEGITPELIQAIIDAILPGVLEAVGATP